ncbi:hypothetical protein [Streptomyces antarcticus]|uniref:hypothetical protein n=1 Tax=Streptomyces antarcticus TaxID=2996458 RepID=UPI00226EF8B2|nr:MULTISPECIES: hypothetical protein [unclassified Streptomyces]MCY0941884.1 hypothetical protein [Streptomyces sp. H34-AA3]MCZ4082843.1 hypothetical protein [Streptomyces sp. H34-S5]
MAENENEESGSFEELISGIETQMNAERLHKQGAYAVTAARISGTVLTEALASGVPYELSKEMAADTWNSIMGVHSLVLESAESGDAVG